MLIGFICVLRAFFCGTPDYSMDQDSDAWWWRGGDAAINIDGKARALDLRGLRLLARLSVHLLG